MEHCTSVPLGLLALMLAFSACRCDGRSQAQRSGGLVHWSDIETAVVAVEGPEGTRCYILKGQDSRELAQSLQENTLTETAPSRTTQTLGGTTLQVFVSDKDGRQLHRFLVDFQYVKGMGDKTNPSPKTSTLQSGQSKRCSVVVKLIRERGTALPKSEYDQFADQFQNVGWLFLYWRS